MCVCRFGAQADAAVAAGLEDTGRSIELLEQIREVFVAAEAAEDAVGALAATEAKTSAQDAREAAPESMSM